MHEKLGAVRRTAALAGCLVLTAGTVFAQVPAPEQVQTFSRIFAFDRALAGRSITVLLVAADPENVELVRAEFQRSGVDSRTTTPDRLAADVSDASVVYFASDAATPEAASVVARSRALSIAAEPGLAESGRVSVALDATGDRIGIVVNVPRLEAEGHSLSPQLLKQPWVEVIGAASADTAGPLRACTVTDFATPTYPPLALRGNVEGTVRLRVDVGADLRAENVEVVESVRFLDDAAVRAADDSRYSTPGPCSLAIPFQLESGD